MNADLAEFGKERYEGLLREASAERRATALPRQPRANPIVLVRRLLVRWRGAAAGVVTLNPPPRAPFPGTSGDE
jgi:hypothetical protein